MLFIVEVARVTDQNQEITLFRFYFVNAHALNFGLESVYIIYMAVEVLGKKYTILLMVKGRL